MCLVQHSPLDSPCVLVKTHAHSIVVCLETVLDCLAHSLVAVHREFTYHVVLKEDGIHSGELALTINHYADLILCLRRYENEHPCTGEWFYGNCAVRFGGLGLKIYKRSIGLPFLCLCRGQR